MNISERKRFLNKILILYSILPVLHKEFEYKKKEFDEFWAQFQNGVVNFKKLSTSFDEAVMLCNLKHMCNIAYKEQKHDISLKLAEYGCLLDSFLPEEEEE